MSAEHAKVVLVGRAWVGDENARELLKLLFPNPYAKTALASR